MNQVDRAASRSNHLFKRQQRNGVGTEAGGSAGDDNGVTSKAHNSSPEDTELELVKQQKVQRVRAQRKHKQQQPTGAFAWEGILPRRRLKVLLVEDDDSTRHVVAALLRNCGYEVISARNGRHAWEILNDGDVGVELVLTDVMMPELSGIELLGRITATETTKQTPVVMMSSVDSMDVVFKCLSKGAVDFLVKPVRKNELKNLWQHFWRKCLSSSGSGGGGSQTGKVDDNDTGGYEDSESGSSGLNVGGGSDNGSGTQSSWTKKPEVRNQPLQPNSPGDGNEDELDGRDREPSDTGSGDEAARGRCLETYTEPSYQAIDLLGNIKDQHKDAVAAAEAEKPPASGTDNTGLADSNSAPTLELSLKRSRPKESEAEGEKRRVLHHSDGSAFSRYSSSGAAAAAATTAAAAAAAAAQTQHGSSFPVSLWVGLGPEGMCVTEGRAGAAEEEMPGGSNSPVKGVEGEATGRKGNEHQHYLPPAPNMMSYDRLAAAYGESLQHLFYPQWKNMASSRKDERATEVHHQFQDGHHHYHHHHHHHYGPGRGGGDGTGGGKEEAAVNKNYPRAGNHQRSQQCASSNVTNVLEATAGAGGSGGSSYCMNGNGGNASVNGSNSGSNNLSNNNVHNGQSNGHSGTAGKGGDSGTNDVNNMNSNTTNNSNSQSNHHQQSNNNGSSSRPGTINSNNNHDSNSGAGGVTCQESTRLTRREAALNKFRQKRKERCFEKKVRYQSRKKLAEQRPRVRGQFVKQGATAATVAELNNRDEELDDELQPED